MKASRASVSVVIPNWNGEEHLAACIRSLQAQTVPARVIVVENGSVDRSAEIMRQDFPDVEMLEFPKNLGFAGGVNAGIRRAMEHGDEFVALMNNDAVAETDWLEELLREIQKDAHVGIATCKIVNFTAESIDSTGEFYSIWGLSFARGRGEPADHRYDGHQDIFGASGGASIFRSSLFTDIGLFDDDFFAYYEDADLSFRAQLRGWKVRFAPKAQVRHRIGATTGKIRGFTTYQTIKNLPLLCIKNVPASMLPSVAPRLWLAHTLFFWSAVARGQGGIALKALGRSWLLIPKKLLERRRIQKSRRVPVSYIREVVVRDLPPGADRLRKLVHPFRKSVQKVNTLT